MYVCDVCVVRHARVCVHICVRVCLARASVCMKARACVCMKTPELGFWSPGLYMCVCVCVYVSAGRHTNPKPLTQEISVCSSDGLKQGYSQGVQFSSDGFIHLS